MRKKCRIIFAALGLLGKLLRLRRKIVVGKEAKRGYLLLLDTNRTKIFVSWLWRRKMRIRWCYRGSWWKFNDLLKDKPMIMLAQRFRIMNRRDLIEIREGYTVRMSHFRIIFSRRMTSMRFWIWIFRKDRPILILAGILRLFIMIRLKCRGKMSQILTKLRTNLKTKTHLLNCRILDLMSDCLIFRSAFVLQKTCLKGLIEKQSIKQPLKSNLGIGELG